MDAKGKPEPDPELRDTEIVALPDDISLPLPLKYDNETGHDQLLTLVKDHCEAYLKAEVLPHVPDAWIAHDKTKGRLRDSAEPAFLRLPARRARWREIAGEISQLEKEIMAMLSEVVDECLLPSFPRRRESRNRSRKPGFPPPIRSRAGSSRE